MTRTYSPKPNEIQRDWLVIDATDIVLGITEFLRQSRVVGAWIEFFGPGADSLTIGDRATISKIRTPLMSAARVLGAAPRRMGALSASSLPSP